MMALVGKHIIWWMDPLGCLCASVIILRLWIREAVEKAGMIAGICADPEMIQLISYTALTHDPRITHLDDVKAYYSGTKMMVEITVIMNPGTPLIVIHNVTNTLTEKLEKIPEVERVIVNVEYKIYSETGQEMDINIIINP
ncbi:hypothetical protein BB561_002035 [Smittium simulii]|uniref:Cation efflux protein cytoplasmic domain-containing protein n=1 Tax=Smittium simulii TaxID=133385 RepID=A0A2T9YS62_9FUNG|nr:hypothetical protein BB561_002035 [Smittium simulii]